MAFLVYLVGRVNLVGVDFLVGVENRVLLVRVVIQDSLERRVRVVQ